MITYQYKARDKFGKLVQGLMIAEGQEGVALKLKQMGCVPITVEVSKKGSTGRKLGDGFRTVKLADINLFTRQLYTLQRAGLPILSSLNTIRQQTERKSFSNVLGQIVRDIEEGKNFTAALERHPAVFDSMYVNMIHAGEVSGKLSDVLERLIVLGEHEEKIRMRIQSAIRYPLIVVAAIIIGFFVLVAFVVPRFAKLYSQSKVALPLPTQILIAINYLVVKFWWALILGAVLAVFAFRSFIRTKAGMAFWDQVKLRVYIFGPLTLKLSLSRFCRITSMLIRSGVPLLQILDLASQSVGNTVVANTIDKIKQSVNEGKGMSEPMGKSHFFPPLVVQMVSVGEQTGKVDELLLHVADYYDTQIDHTISNMVSLIEPVLIVFLGGIVLFMALGIFMPMWNMIHLFQR